ncbi:MAG: hypothetical protein FWD77_09885 [Betaproteobacteria bacterium]|nr:hypothetical protein [Betaproteobacteria bacterium]
MKYRFAFLFFLLLPVFGWAEEKAAPVVPRMSGDISAPECSDAFRLASAMFNSGALRLYAPLNIPDGMESELILGTKELDISGGNELKSIDDQFEKLPQPRYANRHIYWEKNKKTGSRIVMTETPLGWRGDMYDLYLLDANVSQEDFIDARKNDAPRYKPFIENVWRPPLVFLHKPSQSRWFLKVGEPYEVLGDWLVYREATGMFADDIARKGYKGYGGSPLGFWNGCTIRFLPEGTPAISLLPKAVRKLARLLDEAIGPGRDEGTLHQTTRLRLHVDYVWANVAIRPWALSDSNAYNSAQEVQEGLLQWSKTGRSYKRAHDKILSAYPAAQRALSAYYIKQFQLPESEAEELAAWVLDVAFRANFVFPKRSGHYMDDSVNTNPWWQWKQK